jgi:hypothetical protein
MVGVMKSKITSIYPAYINLLLPKYSREKVVDPLPQKQNPVLVKTGTGAKIFQGFRVRRVSAFGGLSVPRSAFTSV